MHLFSQRVQVVVDILYCATRPLSQLNTTAVAITLAECPLLWTLLCTAVVITSQAFPRDFVDVRPLLWRSSLYENTGSLYSELVYEPTVVATASRLSLQHYHKATP